MAKFAPYALRYLIEEQDAEEVRGLAVALLREGCTDPHFLSDLADLLDDKVKTNLIVSIKKPARPVTIHGGKSLRIAMEVRSAIGQKPLTAPQATPPPPIDETRAIELVAAFEKMHPSTVRKYWNSWKEVMADADSELGEKK